MAHTLARPSACGFPDVGVLKLQLVDEWVTRKR